MGIFVPVVVDADHWDAETTSKRVVFIRVGRLCRRVHWTTGTMRDLQVLVCRVFGAPEDLVHVRAKQNDSNPFILFHSESSKGHVDAAPLVWPDADLRNGSVVSVRDPLWQAVLCLCAGEGDDARVKRDKTRGDQNLPPLTPTPPTPFGKERQRKDDRGGGGNDERGGVSSTPSDSESDFSAGSSLAALSPDGTRKRNERERRRSSNDGKIAKYLMPFSGALSAVQHGAVHLVGSGHGGSRKHVARGDLPARLAKKLAQRASVLSNLDDLTTRERVDVLLNDPGSSPAAATISVFMITLIGLSTVTFCVETLPWFYAPEPTFSDPFWIVEAACIAAFTAELSLRAWATNDKITTFFSRGMNVVDLVAILPFYVDLLAKGLTIPGLSVLRVLRLARVFRLLRVSKTAVDLLGQTMRRSARPLYILAFLLMMALITFSAVLYFAERGTYDDTKKLWMRTLGFECEFPCFAETLDFLPAFLTCGDVADETNTVSAYFDRHKPTVAAIASTCERVVEQSPFQSILHAVWWALATMGTVGYGDIAPRTVAGWILASLAQMMGILVIALPITVIGSNFSAIYSSIGTSQSLWAKEHEPSSAAKPRRLHASGSGATAQKLTDGGMVGPLQHEWDLDVAFEELLPCASPALVGGAETNGASGGKIGGFASVSGRSGALVGWTMVRRALTPEEQIEAFINGEDLHENPRSVAEKSADGSPAGALSRKNSLTPKEKAPPADEKEKRASRLGVRDLGAALREAKGDKDKGVVPTNVGEAGTSVPDRPRFEPPKVSRKSGRARRKALCVLVEAFLADCVRNAEVRDKFAATRQRETLKKGDSLFVKVGNTEQKTLTTKKSGFKRSKTAALLRVVESEKNLGVGAGDAGVTRETKNTRAPKTPLPTPGTSFATPRAEDER